jgi:transcriptional regulator with XRE-family HTH domain
LTRSSFDVYVPPIIMMEPNMSATVETATRLKVVGNFLKVRRQKAGLTQQDVARHLEYTSPQFISNWERGVSLPPLDVLPRLATLYRVSARDMIDVMHRYQEQVLKVHKKELVALFKRG